MQTFVLLVHPHLHKKLGHEEFLVSNPAFWRERHEIESYEEPMVKGTIICPNVRSDQSRN